MEGKHGCIPEQPTAVCVLPSGLKATEVTSCQLPAAVPEVNAETSPNSGA